MTTYRSTGLAISIACVFMATSAGATDNNTPGNDQQSADAAGINRDLVREAHAQAVEDAIQAVLQANRLNLDSRINSRSAGRMPLAAVDGR